MSSSIHTQVLEQLSILDEALLQPDKFIGLKLAVGSEIPGFGHDTRVSEVTDENRVLLPSGNQHVPFPGLIALGRGVATASYPWYAVSMKISVSLPEEDVEFLDKYAKSQGYGSRSAVVHTAVRMLRSSKLGGAYADAWGGWGDSS